MSEFELVEYKCDQESYLNSDNVYIFKQFVVQENILVPEGKPNIENLLEVKAHPHIETCKVIQTPFGKKMIVIGEIRQKLLYVADISCQSVHFFHSTRPFCTFLEIPCHKSCCLQENGEYPISHPEIMVEYLCAHKVGDREVAKCLVLVVWIPKHDHHKPDDHCYPSKFLMTLLNIPKLIMFNMLNTNNKSDKTA